MSSEANFGSDANSNLDPRSNLSNSPFDVNHPLGPQANRTPSALGNHVEPSLLGSEQGGDSAATSTDPITGLPVANGTSRQIYGDEFESGIPPIDYAAHLAERAFNEVDRVVEAITPDVSRKFHDTVNHVSEVVQQTVDAVRENWDAPDNELRQAMNDRAHQAHGFVKQFVKQTFQGFSDRPESREVMKTLNRWGREFIDQSGRKIQTARSASETLIDRVFEVAYIDRSSGNQQSHYHISDPPFVGVIDTAFNDQGHGAQIVQAIQQSGQRFPDWLGDTVGTGDWATSLVQFVDRARSSGRTSAIVNLSFDLTQLNPDGRITTRYELTPTERSALSYAREHGVLIVAAAGNQGSLMSALGQAAQEFDNIITIGSAEDGQRADYSSYGKGLSLVVSHNSDELEGTSLSVAQVTATASQVWQANPNWNYHQVIHALESTATDLETPGWDPNTGFGEPNLADAVNLARSSAQSSAQSSAELDPIQPLELSPVISRSLENDRTIQPIPGLQRQDHELANGAIPGERPALLEAGDYTPYPGYVLKYDPNPLQPCDMNVMRWQQRMQDLGWEIKIDGIYGPESEQVARWFQEAQGLTVDGIVGPETWKDAFNPNAIVSPRLERGGLAYPGHVLQYEPSTALTYDSDVQRWQQRMSDRGWDIAVDGLYGPQSAEVAREFQAEKGLAVDGIVGPQTWAAAFDTTNVTGPSSGSASGLSQTPEVPGMTTGNPGQKLLDTAKSYLGVTEQGENQGAAVEKFQSVIGGTVGEPWCMSFVQYAIKTAETATQSRSAIARSESCLEVWERSPAALRHSQPESGSLVIWQDGNSRRGHVGIVESVNADGSFTTIEGNTTNDGVGDGAGPEGVYRKQHDMSPQGDRHILGFLKVFPDDAIGSSQDMGTGQTYAGQIFKYEPGQPLTYNADVAQWQQRMQDLGWKITADGLYGPQSQQVAREFQQQQGLEVDGIVGPQTWAAAFASNKMGSAEADSSNSLAESLQALDKQRIRALAMNDYVRAAKIDQTRQTIFNSAAKRSGSACLNGESKPVRLFRYDQEGVSTQGVDPNKETVVIIHGWKADTESSTVKYPNTGNLAKTVASKSDVQVLSLDWSSITEAGLDDLAVLPDVKPPYKTAGWIGPVAEQAHAQLVDLGIKPDKLTLIGHSLGSYVASEIAAKFGQVKNLVALDPAFPAQNHLLLSGYDLDASEGKAQEDKAQRPKPFHSVANYSLALVAADESQFFSGGVAGDDDQAATAHDSLIVKFPDGFSLEDSHNYVVDTFTNALDQGFLDLPNLTLPNHQDNWYNDFGHKKETGFWSRLKNIGSDLQHEGRVNVTLEETTDKPAHITKLVQVVDESGSEQDTWLANS